jgi:hypothetical protein
VTVRDEILSPARANRFTAALATPPGGSALDGGCVQLALEAVGVASSCRLASSGSIEANSMTPM